MSERTPKIGLARQGGLLSVHLPYGLIEKLIDQTELQKQDLNLKLMKNQQTLVLPHLLATPNLVARKSGAGRRAPKHSKLKLQIFLKLVEKVELV